jgi:outer membrane protein OmpA-like peptidoglycan-associated protein
MKRLVVVLLPLTALFLAEASNAQTQQETPASALTTKSIKAIGYQVGGGGTKVDLVGTSLMAGANGEAKVEAKKGLSTVEVNINGLDSPMKLGTEFLTYVLWAVSPDGRTNNLGEILTNNSGQGKQKATTQAQTFSLFVTAEPYFSVRQPSEMIILENEIRKDTKGKIFIVNDYKLMRRSQYQKMGNPLALSLDLKNVPLDMYQARNAVEIAKSRAADKYAPEIFTKAESSLKQAENLLAGKADKKDISSTARQTVQFAEDARALAVQRQEEERIANERAAAAAQAKADAEAKAAAEAAEAKRKADAEMAAAQAKADAEAAAAKRQADLEAQRQAELAAAREAQMKAEAEAAAYKAKVEADALKAKEAAAKADADRARQAAEALRAQLLEQFNRILDTTDTPRGLVVNMADVLFDTGKFNLRSEAREKLAKLSGIVLGHPGLNLAVEGYTDSTGGEELNQKLSQQRADSVRSYLLEQGLSETDVTAAGFGMSNPVADNSTAAGRQKNRRVEIIVSGEVIGVKIGK